MQPQLDHLIVRVNDKQESAAFLAEILGLDSPVTLEPFEQVDTGNGVSIDFFDGEPPGHRMHLAFLVTEREFDEIFGRVRDRGLGYWGDPSKNTPNEINDRDGGRGVYFDDPSGHLWEILTRPYGSGAET
jgi:catechol 2,3-dioxygenase-like lactoylglutathione lyase family enzyme